MLILGSFWSVLLLTFWAFVLLAALLAVFLTISDLFRDRALSGWAKAAWVVLLIFLPLLGSLIYVIARGRGMPDRIGDAARRRHERADARARADTAE
ncbi:PLDc N-terminal domain-containing protein [Microbacterium sp. H1-D42]|uniref:PLDc N-terminal domain-containing protein n=1 Tax=Microbacterium sp. H1-D42 TaxID=2925844 RepID=UPI001F539C88|nr:PLDc N-terminal domain-containing protein [Microbacterium sp. H1-D42]UNK71574.1 PLDc N-terminal domain-containing protein [Microbacterium sp. H1-D42]